MEITTLTPPDVWNPQEHLFSQCVRVRGAQETLYLAGQTAIDADGEFVGVGDIAVQVATCFDNIEAIVRAAGGTFANVVKLTAYFKDMDYLETYTQELGRRLPERRPAQTVVQVVSLAMPELLVELDAVAVL
jgi:2-iminobutanoate/2-iminopropanoate deaminase